MRKIRTVAVLPTLFTLGNLFCGFFSIVVASRIEKPESAVIPPAPDFHIRSLDFDPRDPTHNAMLSGWLIFLAMVFDALDGHVARLSKTSSDFGAELDSLCDVVTFGVAPGFLLVKMIPQVALIWPPAAIWIIAAAFPACAALRLARFNVETDEHDDHLHFSGLPSPAAAGSIAGFAILFYTLRREHDPNDWGEVLARFDWYVQCALPFFSLIVAFLMISRVPYPHVVNLLFRGQRSFSHVVLLFFGLLMVMLIRGYAVPVLACGFVLYPPLRYLWQRYQQRGAEAEPLF